MVVTWWSLCLLAFEWVGLLLVVLRWIVVVLLMITGFVACCLFVALFGLAFAVVYAVNLVWVLAGLVCVLMFGFDLV